jgi:hypothetical protein
LICRDNDITAHGIDSLAGWIGGSTVLRSLNLGKNPIEKEGVAALCTALHQFPSRSPSLQRLDLPHCKIKGTPAAECFAKMLQSNSTLQVLNVSQNKMGGGGGLPLAKAMTVNRSLRLLSLTDDALCEVQFISACAGLGALATEFELAGHTCTWTRGGGSGSGNTAVVTKTMLTSFYLKHDPTAIARVDEILAAYSPAELHKALKDKYGEVPNDLGVWQESAPAPAPAPASAARVTAPAAPAAEEQGEQNRAAFFASSPWEASATDDFYTPAPLDLPPVEATQAPAPPPPAPVGLPAPEESFTPEEAKAHAEKICEAVRKEVRGDEAMLNQFMAATRQMEKGKLKCPVVSPGLCQNYFCDKPLHICVLPSFAAILFVPTNMPVFLIPVFQIPHRHVRSSICRAASARDSQTVPAALRASPSLLGFSAADR